VLLVNFNFKHGIGEGLKHFALYFDLILFWHSFLSLPARFAFSACEPTRMHQRGSRDTLLQKQVHTLDMIDNCCL